MSDPRYPFGAPVNRPKSPDFVPCPGRPGWWMHRKGVAQYFEPPRDPNL